MITFKKDSWHYKLYRKFYGNWNDMPSSICPYFWKVVWAILFKYILFPIIIIPAIVALVIGSLGAIFVLPWCLLNIIMGHGAALDLWGVDVYHWKALLVDIAAWLILVSTMFVYYWLKFKRKLSSTKENPSIIVEWVKAKKSRICPMIEFKE